MKRNNANGLDRSPVHLLHRAYQSAGDIFRAEMKVEGLTPRQLAVLATVAQNEGLSQTGIVSLTGMDRSTLTDVARRLQRRGLVQRRRKRDDARTYAVKLTGEGRRVLSAAEPAAKSIDARILGALPPGRRDQFLANLSTLVGALELVAAKG